MNNIKIICTLGPSSFKKSILSKLKILGVDIFRINLSHTNKKDISKKIDFLRKNKIKNICLDTEGAQIRTTIIPKKKYLNKNKIIKLFNRDKNSDAKNISLFPKFDIFSLKKGIEIDIGFDNLRLKVIKKFNKKYATAKVIKPGHLESRKGVHIHKNIYIPPFTEKDEYAIKLASKKNIKYFALSFVNNHKDVVSLKKKLKRNFFIISKIETLNAIDDLKKICKSSNALLIDRGDLSRYVPIEKIPIIQEYIIKVSNKYKRPTYVATNLLETMVTQRSPTRAESNDIYSTLKQGAKGLVLAAETAIGSFPVDCVKFLKRCITIYKKN